MHEIFAFAARVALRMISENLSIACSQIPGNTGGRPIIFFNIVGAVS
jgi:hypothetical protein